jgi:hypothetical protein
MPEDIPDGIEYVPMIWGKWSCTQSTVKKLVSQKHTTLLGFNEPGAKKQANLTVEQAIKLWPILMESGMRLGSPANIHADGVWMKAFMKEVDRRGYRVDFIAVHSYMGMDSQHFLRRLGKIHQLYNKPLWITEFAVADWEARVDKANIYSPEHVSDFMETVVPKLEQLDYIERYAWFSSPVVVPSLAPSALFRPDGTLTSLGNLYASF